MYRVVPESRESYPPQYLRIWEFSNKTNGLYSFNANRGLIPTAVTDTYENGASFIAGCKDGLILKDCVKMFKTFCKVKYNRRSYLAIRLST